MNSIYRLTLSRESLKFLSKQERIRKALTGLAIRPPAGDIKPLKGMDKFFRLRVGT